jgi:hypothetical protein
MPEGNHFHFKRSELFLFRLATEYFVLDMATLFFFSLLSSGKEEDRKILGSVAAPLTIGKMEPFYKLRVPRRLVNPTV